VRTEALLFTGVALFFGGVTIPYAMYAEDPAGTSAVFIAFLMASLVAFFLSTQYKRHGRRPEDRRSGEIMERGGPFDFFPPRSAWPVSIALGVAVTATGIVFGLWLVLIGAGITATAVSGFVFQYARAHR
jgi:hypothetical protein